jgi:uncharacterized protein YlzI (FlbEa/FlbD family)
MASFAMLSLRDEFKKVAINPEHVVMVEEIGSSTVITLVHNKTVVVEGDFQAIVTELEQIDE